ncbi:hypothetical protein [Paenibacillus piri]|uniref:Uncharacterized protein n=1 Tax=Paenibacillus piri TaxID=2547395 RepID=A0A4R5KNX6_9BACL|nr:hypothetical protein [Paenibacillus piri]TDF96310.1 hypothetical protein E1757_18180 [Paenibacillus piri]
MVIFYSIVIFVLLCQWIYWIASRYPEIRSMQQGKKRMYRLGAAALLIVAAGLSLLLELTVTAVIPAPHITYFTFITAFMIGLAGILCFRVFLMGSRQVFKQTCMSGIAFSLFLIGVELLCLILLM